MKRRIVMAGTTFFLAAATGHVMQNGDELGAKLRRALSSPEPAATTAPAEAQPAAGAASNSKPTDAVLVSGTTAPAGTTTAPAALVRTAGGLPDFPIVQAQALTSGAPLASRMDAVADDYTRPATDADADYSVFGIPCGASKLDLGLGAGGTLKATLSAPCHPDERVVISHAGFSFAMLTDAAGSAQVTIPAMTTEATVDAGFANGEILSAARQVPDLDGLRRMALSGEGEFRLNAYENGAAYDAEGHYSAERSGDLSKTGGASMVVLGDPGLEQPEIVEVFTAAAATKSVMFEAEAEATKATCGRTVKARVVTMSAGKIGLREVLKQAMPDCDAVGDLVMSPLPGWDGPLDVAASQ